jgi:hypothetical protein
VDGEVVRERDGGRGFIDRKVGEVVGDRDRRGDERVVGEGDGEKEAVDAGRPGIGGGGVGSNVVEGMGGVRGIIEREFFLEGGPGREEGTRGKQRWNQ